MKTTEKTTEKKTHKLPSWTKFCIAPMVLLLLCVFAFVPMGTADMDGDGTEEAYSVFDQLGLSEFAPPTPEQEAADMKAFEEKVEARRNEKREAYLKTVAGDEYDELPDWVLTPSDYYVYKRDQAREEFAKIQEGYNDGTNSAVESGSSNGSSDVNSSDESADTTETEWTYENALKGILEDDFVQSVFGYSGNN